MFFHFSHICYVHPHTQIMLKIWTILAVKKKSHKSINYFNQNSKIRPTLIEGERCHYLRNDICTSQFCYKGNNEVRFIIKVISCLSNLNLRTVHDFGSCLLNVRCLYNHTGDRTFNLITSSSSMRKRQNDFYWINLYLVLILNRFTWMILVPWNNFWRYR